MSKHPCAKCGKKIVAKTAFKVIPVRWKEHSCVRGKRKIKGNGKLITWYGWENEMVLFYHRRCLRSVQ